MSGCLTSMRVVCASQANLWHSRQTTATTITTPNGIVMDPTGKMGCAIAKNKVARVRMITNRERAHSAHKTATRNRCTPVPRISLGVEMEFLRKSYEMNGGDKKTNALLVTFRKTFLPKCNLSTLICITFRLHFSFAPLGNYCQVFRVIVIAPLCHFIQTEHTSFLSHCSYMCVCVWVEMHLAHVRPFVSYT